MSGSRLGGLKARDTQISKIGAEAYSQRMSRIGAIGGQNGKTGGFAANIVCNCDILPTEHYKQRCAGVRGGTKSRRSKTPKGGDNA